MKNMQVVIPGLFKWEPEKLMALYKKTGARYFVSMASHHDNFFLWDPKIHKWNAVNMGPQKDVVGLWQAAARKEGFRFGVSEHLAASYTWFQSAQDMGRNLIARYYNQDMAFRNGKPESCSCRHYVYPQHFSSEHHPDDESAFLKFIRKNGVYLVHAEVPGSYKYYK